VDVICGTGATLAPSLLDELAVYRHRIFIETLKWDLPTENGREQDQFDGPQTGYVIARDETGAICGCARLLPTTGPYLLADVFPQLLHGAPVPRHERIWELSRFASMNCGAPHQLSRQMELKVAEHVFATALHFAARHGVERFVTVSPLGVERLLRRAGLHIHRAGPPVMVAAPAGALRAAARARRARVARQCPRRHGGHGPQLDLNGPGCAFRAAR
jgi:acyl homoserine lactone synthase